MKQALRKKIDTLITVFLVLLALTGLALIVYGIIILNS